MIDRLCTCARDAGAMAREQAGRLRAEDIRAKSAVDMVTRVDHELETFIADRLKREFPDTAFIGEEGEYTHDVNSGRVFIVDPLDGTTGFIHGHPFFAVSIAFLEAGQAQAGVVYLPVFDQLFWAEKGGGAYHDGTRIHVSTTDRLINSLVATGFACVRERRTPNNLPLFEDMLYRVRGIRRCGSAAIDLCYVAAGIYDVYWEYGLKPWDVAAGSLIVREAGGRVSDLLGEAELSTHDSIVASNDTLHDCVLDVTRRYASAGR